MKKTGHIVIILLIAIIGPSKTLHCQVDSLNFKLNRNAVYGNVGYVGFAASAAGYYERILTQRLKSEKLLARYIKVGYGTQGTSGSSTYFISAQYGILVGKGGSYLELGVGPSYYTDDGLNDFPLNATLGWRVQYPKKGAVIRMGVAWPEILYIGFGVSF